jgi:endonuclease/exonuclease/phosphatase family metal-dependent hydrolase
MLFLGTLKKKTTLVPLALLVIGWPFISSTISLSQPKILNGSISVLSFNAKLFRKPNVYDKFSTEMIKWVANDSSDIKCIQEYSTNANWPALDATTQIKEKGYRGYTFRANVIDNDHNPGLAIFSKFEIVNSGIVFEDIHTHNAAIFADLEINNKIVRIYNVHLASMNLELNEEVGFRKIFQITKKLKRGAVKRATQLNALLGHAQLSPYPLIICGDLNETPYSYTYFQLKKHFKNAFENAGHGLGFTLNEMPYLVRIDHQFHHSKIQALKYEVNRKMNISDHFPTHGYYKISE